MSRSLGFKGLGFAVTDSWLMVWDGDWAVWDMEKKDKGCIGMAQGVRSHCVYRCICRRLCGFGFRDLLRRAQRRGM